ncbi:MAG: HD domain-containing protein [Clostridiaceae bacterium]|jgi:predicted HD superfamily hydrolase involved in NAD metabolism|nr:HD domain-containing protein [Clostridiaceae bacterium]
MNIEDMKIKLQQSLNEKRYLHSIGVMDECEKLALHYEADVNKARIAGLLHDCAKNISQSEENTLLNKYEIKLDDIQKQSHALVHGILGMYVAREKYNINDEEILDAIYWHTTGRAGMTLLEKIVFIADYIEPARTFDDTEEIRKNAYEDIDRAIVLSADSTIRYLLERKKLVHPLTLDTRNDAILTLYKKASKS